MKQDIHPEYKITNVTCSCGNTFTTRSVAGDLHVELCNQCHPFYTGKQKLVDTGGRVERFQKKYAAKRKRPAPAPEATPEPQAQAEDKPAEPDRSEAPDATDVPAGGEELVPEPPAPDEAGSEESASEGSSDPDATEGSQPEEPQA